MRVIPDDVWGAITVWAEARGEPYLGQVAVARVIRNRIKQGWAHDAAGVVLQPYQFSCWNTQDPNRLAAARMSSEDPEVQSCQKAWAESATNDAGIGEAVMYFAPRAVSQTPKWATPDKHVVTISHHEFYRG